MPRVRRARTIAAPREDLWAIVSDPHALPRWWPSVVRVEEATDSAWTKVLKADRGKPVRADFTRVVHDSPERIAWRQEVAGSPFERILSRAVTEVSLEPVEAGATRVEIRSRQRLRGLATLGWPMVRRASGRQLEGALDGLERAARPDPSA